MALTISQGGSGPSELAPAGIHRAICCGVIDLGTQCFEFNGEARELHKVMLRWELSDEPAQADGRPLQISREFTASLHEKSALRPFLVGWRGKPFTPEELARFDMAALLGQPCQLSVVHETSKKGREFANVMSASRLGKGQAAPEPIADHVYYQIEDGDPPAELPEWIRKKIDASVERSGRPAAAAATPTPAAANPRAAGAAFSAADDDIPF